jgi:structure-specific recognition protein 1
LPTLGICRSDIAENIKEKLEPHYEAPTYEIVSTLCKTLTQRKVTVPSDFKSQYDAAAFKCSMKANEGYLYPLEKCFLFIPKPPTFIPNQDIESVTFARISSAAAGSRGFDAGGSRTFDIKFTMKSGLEYQFSSINRSVTMRRVLIKQPLSRLLTMGRIIERNIGKYLTFLTQRGSR